MLIVTQMFPHSPWLSVILPCWRDETCVLRWLELFAQEPGTQWIVCLARKPHESAQKIKALGGLVVEMEAPNRGLQLHQGASVAQGDILLFHHADSTLTPAHLHSLRTLHLDAQWSWGAFYRKFDQRHPYLLRFEPVERWHNRTFGAIYGDQSIFIRREFYCQQGGFAPLPLMEDVEFSLRLRRCSPPRMIDPPMASSPRKHLTQGPWRTTLGNLLALWAFRLGVPAAHLHAWYYRSLQLNGNKSQTQPS